MADLRIGDSVRHRFNGDAIGIIVEVRTTSDPDFRLIRVRWTSGPVLDLTWEAEDNLTVSS
jgi:hypothetical protein